ncbi:acyltransferase family protein [Paraburkholderia dilworthii]|uniref:Acyltransferase n=1 Tax=Paraburkholderia dilworthii TaxID=948106 RepID=A0ABW9DBS8_9BURK
MNNQRLEFANALRGLAALSVLISHYLGIFWFARPIAGILANATVPDASVIPTPHLAVLLDAFPVATGPFGVALFFMISGFVIPFTFERTSVSGFIAGRILRIYPLYMAGFTITLIALTLSGIASGKPFPYTFANVVVHYFPGLRDLVWLPSIDGIVWTLEIELKFYVVCALIAPLLRQGRIWTFLVPMVLLATVQLGHGYPWGTLTKTLALDSEYMLFMFCGVAFNFHSRGFFNLRTLAVVSLAVLAAFCAAMMISAEPIRSIYSYIAAFTLFALAASISRSWPRFRLLSFFADISYPLYVVHGVMGYALIAFMINRGFSPWTAISCATVLAIALAWLLHVLVEVRAHRIGKQLSKRLTDRSGLIPVARDA